MRVVVMLCAGWPPPAASGPAGATWRRRRREGEPGGRSGGGEGERERRGGRGEGAGGAGMGAGRMGNDAGAAGRGGGETVRVLVTGAAGQIRYALAPMVARGHLLGPRTRVVLHLLDVPQAAEALRGLVMELEDMALPLLADVMATTDLAEACAGVEVAVMLGGAPRRPGQVRRDMLAANVVIYREQGAALARHANPEVKVLVVANPANTNAWVLAQHAQGLPARNVSALTRLDHNRCLGILGKRMRGGAGYTGAPLDIKRVAVWGNHSAKQVPDVHHATVGGGEGRSPLRDAVGDDGGWLDGEFVEQVRMRGEAVIKARNASSALSAAASACDHVRSWLRGTPEGDWVSMAVPSDGSYGIPEGLVYSFPVTCDGGQWSIVQGLDLNKHTREMMQASVAELEEERETALAILNPEQPSSSVEDAAVLVETAVLVA